MKEDTKGRKRALCDHLKTSVLTLDLAPGADLDEAALSDAFGLSRTPLREVFQLLAGEGYLELRSNRSARVSELSYTTLRDFFQAAPMIYAAILRLAVLNAKAPQITALKEAQENFRAALSAQSVRDRALANNRFHEITGDMSGNVYLLPSFRRLLIDHARISMTFYQPHSAGNEQAVQTACSHHDGIIAAIEARDPDTAAQLGVDHWELSRGEIERFVMPAALEMTLGTVPLTQMEGVPA